MNISWKMKARIQKILSRIPGGEHLYYFGQSRWGRLKDFKIQSKLMHARRILFNMNSIGKSFQNKTGFEIGPGWAPVFPLLFWLLGQKKCFCYDKARLMRDSLVILTTRQLSQFLCNIDSEKIFGKNVVCEIYETRKNILKKLTQKNIKAAKIFETCNIVYQAPVDTMETGLLSESIDFVFSNLVLQNIPLADLHRIFLEARRILRPGGLMIHLIDPSDQFSHTDPAISPINFLQFSDHEFKKYNSSFLWQSRLRASHYKELFLSHGFKILLWESRVNKRALTSLPTLSLDKAYRFLPPEDICSGSICIIAEK